MVTANHTSNPENNSPSTAFSGNKYADSCCSGAGIRPVNQRHYGQIDLAELAAVYAFGLARNHAFVDGNKRIAFHGMMAFLRGNGIPFAPDPAHATAMLLSLAAGEVKEEG